MIEALRIENLAIVESEELEFGPGLNVLTGETGAGKSIVLGALALLAGARVNPQIVREGCDEAAVDAIFRTDGLAELATDLTQRGFGSAESELVVRRTVARGGRSRARLGGQLVPATLLAELFRGRIEISSQHDSQALLRPETHGRLLDRAAGLTKLRTVVAEQYGQLRSLDTELAELLSAERDRERRRDFLRYQVSEIDDAGLEPDAVDELRTNRSRLANAERLREQGAAAHAMLCGDLAGFDDSNAGDRLAEAARRLEALAELDPGLEPLLSRVRSANEEVRDVSAELERYVSAIEADPARLAAADQRLSQVEMLQRKYGGSVEEVLVFRDEAARELAALEGAGERAAEIEIERAQLVDQLAADAAKLSAGRKKAGRKVAKSVENSLRELAMPQARFRIALEPSAAPEGAPCGPGGNEAPEFRFSAGASGELLPLRKVASGGELSRAFLAIKSAIREADAGMVLIFDEVDAGIGGAVADKVGRSLAELAVRHQVLCITHLPQIAAYANTHFRVQKSEQRSGTRVSVIKVEGRERVEEIARMAGGEEIGEATRRHARELLRSHTSF
ncbi:MAG: DNA repair protein RecN [Myxococcota bacterium]